MDRYSKLPPATVVPYFAEEDHDGTFWVLEELVETPESLYTP
jgi:hypothetical protein